MTTYKIIYNTDDNAFFVIQTLKHGHTTHQDVRHGPYKNEESAKRRIRDLKRKEATAETGMKADGDIGTKCITAQVAANIDEDRRNDMARDDHPRGPALEDALCEDEGCPQSATDHVCIDQPIIHNFEIRETLPLPPLRQRGVYPAVSKHSYQR